MATLPAIVHQHYATRSYEQVEAIPRETPPRVAIVFGAGLWRDGSPTPILYDRVASAIDLYKAGRVTKLLLSGERNGGHNEPLAMMRVAQALGVPASALIPDYAGLRTYDSCYRAKEIFGVTHAIVVTQKFHLDRATYLCDQLGIDTIAYVADRRRFSTQLETYWSLREYPSLLLAVLDVNVLHPEPELGKRMPIE
jgi:vancomycin permeability regulator SanA